MGPTGIDLDSLSYEERLRLLDELVESLASAEDDFPLSDEQRAELNRRLDEIESGRAEEPVPWEVVLRRLRAKR